jgi:hypothetical protein
MDTAPAVACTLERPLVPNAPAGVTTAPPSTNWVGYLAKWATPQPIDPTRIRVYSWSGSSVIWGLELPHYLVNASSGRHRQFEAARLVGDPAAS